MKRTLLTTSALISAGLLALVGCAIDDSSNPGTGTGTGTNGTGGDSSGTNGTSAGGDPSTGAAGNGVGVGGDPGAGGMNAMGGNPNMGGMAGVGVGGMAGMGMGGMGMGGGGACAGAACIDAVAGLKSNFGFMWKDSWFITGCDNKQGHDCITIPTCPNQGAANFEDKGAVANEIFPLGGVAGTTYNVTFKYNGLAEGKYYQAGGYAMAATDVATVGGANPAINENGTSNDNFYIGGTAVGSNYNVMRIRVMDATMKEVGRYYMNAYPGNTGAESHRTFLNSYTHTIPVPGKGSVEYHIEDSNCHAIDNCGPGNVSDTVCDAARSIPNEPAAVLPAQYTNVKKQATTPAATPAPVMVPLAELNPVTGAKQPWHSQISHFTITKIEVKP